MQTAVRSKTITQGLKYSLATGNWGANKTAGTRSGVSQVYFIKLKTFYEKLYLLLVCRCLTDLLSPLLSVTCVV